jgi:hypothetical protein
VRADIYQKEGVRGLWRGLGPNLMGIFPSRYEHGSSIAAAGLALLEVGADGVCMDGPGAAPSISTPMHFASRAF